MIETPFNQTDLLDCLKPRDAERAAATIRELQPYIDNSYAVVGGWAIRHIAHVNGLAGPDRPLGDIDLIIKGDQPLAPDVDKDFAIAHFHEAPAGKFLKLFHRKNGMKVDIFHWPICQSDISLVPFDGSSLPVQSPEDQYAKTVWDMTKVLRGEPVDPKQFEDAALLQPVADPVASNHIFAQLYGRRQPSLSTISEAYNHALLAVDEKPELLVTNPHEPLGNLSCGQCVTDGPYDLTSLEKIQSEFFS
jgi:hypothetical protein